MITPKTAAADRPVLGIDVSKALLDLSCDTSAESWQVANRQTEFGALITRLRALSPARIILEASGGYEMPLVTALSTARLPVCLVNPKRVRDFAKG